MIDQATRDHHIRQALRSKLVRQHAGDRDAFVVEELPIARGGARVDMAVINGKIEGFEIKSSKDTLERLPRQMALFGGAMDRMTLIAAPKHLEEAVKIVPEWWSVFSAAVGTRGSVVLRRVRAGRMNPNRCPRACVNLLERDEIVSLLSSHSLDRGFRTAGWSDLAERAIELLTPKAIAEGVRRQLKNRVILEARFSRTAFGALAAGGGLDLDTDLGMQRLLG